MNKLRIDKYYLIPAHMSLKDWWMYYKHKLNVIWYKYIGKYKIINSTKGRFVPYSQVVFILSEKQSEQVRTTYCKEYRFIPTGIGLAFEIVDKNNNIIDLTDYDTW